MSGVGKSAAGNTILGREEFISEASPSSLTLTSQRGEGEVCGRRVIVVDTPGLCNTELSGEKLREEMQRAVTLCEPKPHAVLLVIQLGRFTEQEKRVMETLRELFSKRVNEYTMVLFTYGDRLRNKTIEEFIRSDTNLQQLLRKCVDRYHVFNNEVMTNCSQVSELLQKIDKMVATEATEEGETQPKKRKRDELGEVNVLPPMSLVLVGMSGVGKSAAGNTILGREEFISEASPSSLTLTSQRGEGEVCGRRVIVVDTPGLCNTELSGEKLREEMQRAVTLCEPKPHAVLLVIQLGRFTEQEKRVMETLRELFSKRVNEYTMVLFTYGDRLRNKTIEEFIRSDTNLQQLLRKCVDRYHVFNNEVMTNCSQVSELLQKIDKMVATEATEEGETQPKKRKRDELGEANVLPPMSLVLVGMSGVGKSAAGNTILGREEFISEASPSSLTLTSQRGEGEVCGRRVIVVDTPGLCNTELSGEKLREEMQRAVTLCEPKPHAVLLVIQLGRFTEQEKRVMETLRELFSKRVNEYTMVLFTYGDRLRNKTIEEFIRSDTNLQQLLRKCVDRYHVFNNEVMTNCSQVSELLQKIDKMVATEATEEGETQPKRPKRDELGEANVLPPMSLVLVGMSGVGKSAAGNTILGREEFISEASPSSLTLTSQRGEGQVCGRRVIVVDTPGLCNTALSGNELREEMQRAVTLCEPKPHAVLLVIQLGRFTEQEKRVMETLRELFSKRVNEYTMVLFTYGDRLRNTTIEEFIRSDTNLQQLLRKCVDRYHVFNNEVMTNCSQVSELLQKIDKMVATEATEEGETQPKRPKRDELGEANVLPPMSLVLVGMSGVGKSAAGNTILGREEFISEASPSSLTLTSQRGEGEVCGRRVIVVDTPGLCNTELSGNELREEMQRAVTLCDPKPHAVLLVIQLGRFTEQEKRVMETLRELFSKRVNEYTMVLFTYGDRLRNKTIEEFIRSDTNLQQLLRKCVDRYHVFNNEVMTNCSQVSELLQKIDKMVATEATEEGETQPKKRKRDELGEANVLPPMSLVLVGMSGVGKSAAGNTILGREEFISEASPSSLTLTSQRGEGEVCGRRVIVVDTPGLCNTALSGNELREEMQRAVTLCEPKPHAVLLVIQLGRFTEQEKRVMETLRELFSKRVNEYTMVLFTYGDRLRNKTIEEFIRSDTNLQQLLRKCVDRYHVFNNEVMTNCSQVSELLQKIDKMVATEATEEGETQTKRPKRDELGEANVLPPMSLVLVGMSGVGKSAAGNTILGREEFISEASPSSLTLTSQRGEGEVCGRRVIVVDTPGLCNTALSGNELREEMQRAVTLCEPKPHAVLLVIQLGRFTEQEKRVMETLRELFSKRVNEYTMVLFTYGDRLRKKTIEEFIRSDTNLQQLLRKCVDRYHVFNNEVMTNCSQVSELLQKIDKMVATEATEEGETQPKRPKRDELGEASVLPPMSLVLVGMSGVGKSAAGNTILGREEFISEASPSSLTLTSQRGEGEVCGRRVIVVDTPGLCNTALSGNELREEMQRAVTLCEPKPHAVLLVIQLGRFTEQEKRVMETLRELFSKRVNEYTMVLFTYGDRLRNKTIEEFIRSDTNLQQLLGKCVDRYHVFNNEVMTNCSQVSELLQKIDKMVATEATEEGETQPKRPKRD
ncbi:hypothetical protein SKAU_G00042760 [Synaphobranchus kaupii]|uniref:GTPase IMAP family member 8 n=1 Tax=Synaphobranchus kaupii TaxID=118154 RepID=A0A9Q1J7W8_SYNKA|nr:hypothetical protein SKAU_G00042760 [Synaphobranchus kaupii]